MHFGFFQRVFKEMVFSSTAHVQDYRGAFLSQCHGSKRAGREAMTTCHVGATDSMLCLREGCPMCRSLKVCRVPRYLGSEMAVITYRARSALFQGVLWAYCCVPPPFIC